MQDISSVYEHVRDHYRYPTCWRAVDNACFSHFHTSLELVHVQQGCMEGVVANQHFTVEAQELLVVPSYAVHRYSTPRYSDTTVLIVPLDYLSRLQGIQGDRTFRCQLLADSPQTREIAHCMRVLAEKETVSDSPVVRGYVQVVAGLLLELIPLAESSAGRDVGQVQNILSYLHENFRSPIGLQQLADRFGYSSSRFSHVFNENVGCSISQYVNTLRCRHAAGILLEQQVSVLEAAMSSGFESMRTFYRAFRQCFGVTPSQYVALSKHGSHAEEQQSAEL